ncbi:thioredoxin C-1-like [Diadema antillarum]|uniref:thioredoxin C-1-like n=1 Tax=Diadema antillarum TaxID=105358 RepID=UPI003A88E306
MSTKHLIQRVILRQSSVLVATRPAVLQSGVAKAACQTSSITSSVTKRLLPVTCHSASFHSSRNLLDENHFNIQDEEDFKEKVISSDSPVIVDFHAEWCAPCKALAPVLDAVLANTEGQVKLAKVDIDELQDLAIGYGVNSVPTVMAFKGGEKVDSFIGLQSKDRIERFVEKLLS